MTSWIEIAAERLTGNFKAAAAMVAEEVGTGAELLAVVKADAYGHGLAQCAPALAAAGAAWLGVTDAEEGRRVRQALAANPPPGDRQPRVLVMCGMMAEDAHLVVQEKLTPVVWRRGQMEALAAAGGAGVPLPVHVEVETGMSRQGVRVQELGDLLRWIKAERRLRVEGVMTHFASAEVAGSAQTAEQREQFEAALGVFVEEAVRPEWVHAGNTSAIDNAADAGTLAWLGRVATGAGARGMVRSGLGLYGYCLPLAGLVASDGPGASRLSRRVQPVMTWKTRVVALSEVEPGEAVGYGGTFVATQPMRLALLPVGYADGLRRELSGTTAKPGGWVMVQGKRARIVGRVSMNLAMVDVTEIEAVRAGDEVVLLGEGITAEDHAAVAGTIAYDILCGVKTRKHG